MPGTFLLIRVDAVSRLTQPALSVEPATPGSMGS